MAPRIHSNTPLKLLAEHDSKPQRVLRVMLILPDNGVHSQFQYYDGFVTY